SGSLAPDINRNFTTATATSTTTCGTAPAPTPAAGLVAYWRFDDGAGTDSSGNNLNGTLVNNPSCTSGKIGNALSFNGSNYVSVPASAALGNLTNNFTVTAWISPADLTSTHRIIGPSKVASNNGFGFGTYGSGLIFTTFNVQDYISSVITLGTGAWVHVAAVMNNNNVTFYVNGVSRQTVTGASPGNPNTDDPYYLGNTTYIGTPSLAEGWNGSLDDIRIFNRVLSASEIQTIYTDTGTGTVTLPSAPSI